MGVDGIEILDSNPARQVGVHQRSSADLRGTAAPRWIRTGAVDTISDRKQQRGILIVFFGFLPTM